MLAMLTPKQEQCLAMFPGSDACNQCACMNCTQAVLDCRDSGDATRDMQCSAVVECARKNDCTGDPCYCGTLGAVQCALTDPAPGPCVDEIEAAIGGLTGAVNVSLRRADKNFSLYWADTLGTCSVMNCHDVCP